MTENRTSPRSGRPIVVGFSASASSVDALRWALAEARRQDAPVAVVHIHDRSDRADLPPGTVGAEDGAACRLINERALRCLDPDDEAAAVTIAHVRGDLAQVLQEKASTAAMLVIGRVGDARHHQLAERLRGQVSCPVVSV